MSWGVLQTIEERAALADKVRMGFAEEERAGLRPPIKMPRRRLDGRTARRFHGLDDIEGGDFRW